MTHSWACQYQNLGVHEASQSGNSSEILPVEECLVGCMHALKYLILIKES